MKRINAISALTRTPSARSSAKSSAKESPNCGRARPVIDWSSRSFGRTPITLAIGLLAAVFGGPMFAAVNTTTTLAVTSAGAATTTVTAGTAVTLTATVVSSGTVVTPGTVTFCDATINTTCGGPAVVGTAQLTPAGKASIVLRLGIGAHSLEAVFAGTSVYASSASSSSALSVTGTYGSATTISSAPGSEAGVYDLTAIVSGYGPLTLAAPTGTVTFLDASNSGTQLATASLGDGTISQALGFIHSSTPSVSGLIASSAAVGDFNGDGNPDFAVTNTANNTVQIFLGAGDGTFASQASYAVGQDPYFLVSGDLNNDGKLDLIAVNSTDSTVSILLGNGDGTFQAQKTYATGNAPLAVAMGDFNGDGNLDLVVAVSQGISILLGNGDGTFQPEQTDAVEATDYLDNTIPVMPQSVTVGDFNGDGKLDIATANIGTSNETSLNNSVSVLLGNGDGTFQPAVFYSTGLSSSSLAIGDFNGDGTADLAVTNFPSSGIVAGEASSFSVLLGNADGTFQAPLTSNLPLYTGPSSIRVSDFNGDGKADLAIGNGAGGYTGNFADLILILLGNGDGTFQPQVGYGPASTDYGYSRNIAIGDFNGDGKPDLVSLEDVYPPVSIGAAVLLNTGASTTVTVQGVAIPGGSSQLVQASYSGDSLYNSSVSAAISLSPIAPAPLSWANPAPIQYGTALSATQLNATSTVDGTFVYTPAAGTVLGAGMQTLSVVFTPTDITDSTPATQTVTLVVNPAPLMASANNAARVFGAPNPTFTGTITGAVNGDSLTETFSTTATTASIVGGYPIVPSVSGANAANYVISATNGTLTVSQAGTATTFALSNQNTTFTATVASLTSGVPTGTVRFYEGQTLVGTGNLTGGVASYTASSLPAGNSIVNAEYSGDANFTQSASPSIPLLSVVPANTSLTVAQSGSVVDKVDLSVAAGYAGTIQLSCSGLPQAATCSFQPSSIAFSGTNNASSVSVTIQTGVSSQAGLRRLLPLDGDSLAGTLAVVFWVPGLFSSILAGRGRKIGSYPAKLSFLLLLCGIGVAMSACGSGSSSTMNPSGTQSPTGTYTVQLIVSGSSGLSQTTDLNLTVQ